ncbi:DUF3888 domain-containing protein [Saccharococcus thermophilus]|jgi:hypothetical protein
MMKRGTVMLSKKLLLLLFGIFLVVGTNNAESKVNQAAATAEQLEDLSIYFLTPYITKSVLNYYGKKSGTQWWKAKIINVKNLEQESNYHFLITVQVETFQGAHNPPYATDIMTFHIKNDRITLIRYQHYKEYTYAQDCWACWPFFYRWEKMFSIMFE